MQINVLPASHPGAMTMLSLPEIAPQAREWVSQQLQSATSMLTDVSRGFLDRARELHAVYGDGTLDRAVRRVTRTVKTLLHPNMIIPLSTVGQIQSCQPVMQRYVMAQPNLRTLYHKQLVDGFSDSYHDYEPGMVGEDHYDYRRVMQNVVRTEIDPETEEERMVFTRYLEDLREDDRELTSDEQFIILDVWDVAKYALSQKIDPSDIFNGSIGG